MSNEDTLERVRQFVSAANWFHDPHGVAVEIPHDVWRALQARFLPGSESRRGSVMAGAIFDGVAPWDTKEMLRRARADNPPYADQVRKHPKAFDFEGRCNYIRSSGSIAVGETGVYSPRIGQYRRMLQEGSEAWPSAVDWRAPEINPDALEEVTC